MSSNSNKQSKFFRLEDPVICEETGAVIKGGMFPHQRQMWLSDANIKALVGGYGAGKTLYAAKRGIALALHNAPSPVMIVSPSYKQARGTTIITIQQILNARKIKYTYNKSEFEFNIMHNGRHGKIWICSGDNPDSLKGPNISAAIIDEPFIQDESVFTQMQARVRDPKAKYREIVLTGTPEQLNWGYDICAGDKKHMYDIEIIQAPTFANKSLPKEALKTMFAGVDPKMREAYEKGEFVNLSSGMIYYAFERSKHVTKVEVGKDETIYIGMDFNVNPMSFVAFVRRGDKLFFFKEYALSNSDTTEACNMIIDEFGDRCKIIFPDPACIQRRTSAKAGQTDKKLIESAGFEAVCRRSHPTKRDRYNAVNSKFDSMDIYIDESCKMLIKGLEQMNHEDLAKQERAVKGNLTHMIDAFGYPVEYIFPIGRILTKRKVWLQ